MTERDPEDKASKGAMGDQAADTGEPEVGHFEGEDQHGSSPDVEPSDALREAGEKSQAGHDTHSASKADGPIEVDPAEGTDVVGDSVNKQGNEQALKKDEPGRFTEGTDDAGRPIGKSSARMSSGVNPQDPVDDDMPEAPAGDQGS